MQLDKKKALASRVLGAGKDRIVFNTSRLSDIKDALSKQDIRDLAASGAIIVGEIKGSKKHVPRKNRRRAGSIKNKVRNSKRTYVILTRKLRRHLFELRKQGKLSREKYYTLRKEVRARAFRNKAHFKEHIAQLQ